MKADSLLNKRYELVMHNCTFIK